MTNDDVINFVSKRNSIYISSEMNDFIQKNYKDIEHNSGSAMKDVKWHIICKDGNDYKYGRYAICPEKQLQRSLTFDEFYGGAVVD